MGKGKREGGCLRRAAEERIIWKIIIYKKEGRLILRRAAEEREREREKAEEERKISGKEIYECILSLSLSFSIDFLTAFCRRKITERNERNRRNRVGL